LGLGSVHKSVPIIPTSDGFASVGDGEEAFAARAREKVLAFFLAGKKITT
jgi:hypothetical protein